MIPRRRFATQLMILNGVRALTWMAGIFLLVVIGAHSAKAEPAPNFENAFWIWADADGDGVAQADEPGSAEAFLTERFTLPAKLDDTEALLSAAADSHAEIFLNGVSVGTTSNWNAPLAVDVSHYLVTGENVLAVHASHVDLPKAAGGFIGALDVRSAGTELLRIVTDRSWAGVVEPPASWPKPTTVAASRPAVELTAAGGFPWLHLPGAGDGITRAPEFLIGKDATLLAPLNALFRKHYVVGVNCTLWDPWLPRSLLWAGSEPERMQQLRRTYARSFLARRFTEAGYVEIRQHRGLGLPEGWPFPLWTQGPGVGWHFSVAGVPFGAPHGIVRTTDISGWKLAGIAFSGTDPGLGLKLRLTSANASLATPEFRAEQKVSPFVRLEWRAQDLAPDSQPYLEWTTAAHPEFSPERRLYFEPIQAGDGLVFTVLPIRKVKDSEDPLTRFRIQFNNDSPANVQITALFTAVDSRKPITNPDFILGSSDFFNWTGDLNFLRAQINRLRKSMAFILDEFGVEANGIAYVPWPGHEGRSGVTWVDGKKVLRPGEGIGNNYYDLLPFGAWDAYLNIRVYAALRALADLEAAAETNPQWNLPDSPMTHSAAELEALAIRVRENFQSKFWNKTTERFVGAIDADGVAHDYGFTPVNTQAIVYGLASAEQARSIYSWMDGERIVETDTSKGADVYKWRFAPRVTTVRNIDYYAYVWSAPESINFGDQIQDGGAVLGFSYYDIMARLKTLGPDNAWTRLKAILDWYREVEAYGGYRKYYADHDGTLQGGGTAGGLGLDYEFMETVMLPSVVIYGFLGLEPSATGLRANPQLPVDWPDLTVTDIAYRDWTFDARVDPKAKVFQVKFHRGDADSFRMELPQGWKLQIN